jgi:hypothetical protein
VKQRQRWPRDSHSPTPAVTVLTHWQIAVVERPEKPTRVTPEVRVLLMTCSGALRQTDNRKLICHEESQKRIIFNFLYFF